MIKHISRWLIVLAMIIAIVAAASNLDKTSVDGKSSEKDTIIDQVIFPHDEVVEVNIIIDEDVLADMNENAIDEQYVSADIEYNGYTISNVAIRPKGNSSLQQVVSSDSDRYSIKVDFNYYLSDQTFLGITKLNLNNIFSDDTLMAEYLGYEMLESIDADVARTTYVALSFNGDYHGLYLAVEEVNESFISDHYETTDGALYKPNMGTGSDLVYISETIEDYTDIIDETNSSDDGSAFIDLTKEIQNVLNEEGDLAKVLNVDSFLKYLAFSTATIHLDSYQSGMNHNYYLYNNDGVFEWITWDLNMIFNKFPRANLTQEEAINFYIDEPVVGNLDKYDLIEAVFKNEEYVEAYHSYLEELTNGYLEDDFFEERVIEVFDMIKSYASMDPTAFVSVEVAQESLFLSNEEALSLLEFMSLRVDSIEEQLAGEKESTNNGQGNVGSKTDMQGRMGPGQMGERPDGLEGLEPGADRPEGLEPGADRPVMSDNMEQGEKRQVLNNENLLEKDTKNIGEGSTQNESLSLVLALSAIMVAAIVYLKKYL